MPVIKAILRLGTLFFSMEFELEASLTSGLVLLAFGTSSLLAIVERTFCNDRQYEYVTYTRLCVLWVLVIKWRNPGRFLLHMVPLAVFNRDRRINNLYLYSFIVKPYGFPVMMVIEQNFTWHLINLGQFYSETGLVLS